MTIQEELITEPEYNPLRTPNNKQAYNYEFDTYYNKGNYHNYNCRNTFNSQYQQQQHKIRIPKINIKQVQKIQKKKSIYQK